MPSIYLWYTEAGQVKRRTSNNWISLLQFGLCRNLDNYWFSVHFCWYMRWTECHCVSMCVCTRRNVFLLLDGITLSTRQTWITQQSVAFILAHFLLCKIKSSSQHFFTAHIYIDIYHILNVYVLCNIGPLEVRGIFVGIVTGSYAPLCDVMKITHNFKEVHNTTLVVLFVIFAIPSLYTPCRCIVVYCCCSCTYSCKS